MKRLTSFLGTIQTSPIWLRACLAVPFLTAVAVLLVTAGQSCVHAFLPAGDAVSSNVPAAATPSGANSLEGREKGTTDAATSTPVATTGTVVVHASLGGNLQRIDGDPQRISVSQ